MKVLSYFILSALTVIITLSPGCAINGDQPPGNSEPIIGMIYAIDKENILVVGEISDANIPRENWFEAGKRAVYFTVTDNTVVEIDGASASIKELARGQKVAVFHSGFLAESYPEQGGALKVVVTEDTRAGEFSTVSGRFMELNENGLMEIKISGVPDELPSRLFNLTPEAGLLPEKLSLQPEEVIIIHYLPDEDSDGLIFDLGRIVN